MVLPARPRPLPWQDQPAERRRSCRIHRSTKKLRRRSAKLAHRPRRSGPGHAGPFGQEPQRARESTPAHPRRDHRRYAGPRCRDAEILENIRGLTTNLYHVLFDPNRTNMVARSVGEVVTLQRGFDLPRKHRKSGPYPIVSSSGKIDDHVEAKVVGPGVTTGRSGSIGNVFYIENDFWPLNTSLYVKDFHGNNVRFIFHLLRELRLERFASGTGVPTLNRNDVHSEIVHLPSKLVSSGDCRST